MAILIPWNPVFSSLALRAGANTPANLASNRRVVAGVVRSGHSLGPATLNVAVCLARTGDETDPALSTLQRRRVPDRSTFLGVSSCTLALRHAASTIADHNREDEEACAFPFLFWWRP